MTDRLSALDLAEAFHLAHAATALDELGVIDALGEGASLDEAASGLDARWVRTLLEFLATRTELIDRTAGGYVPTASFDPTARWVLGQFVGTYGPNAAALPDLLRDPTRAASLVDRERHAAAYSRTSSVMVELVADVIVRLGLGNVLDLGCGPGWLMGELAMRTPMRMWGLDSSPAMRAIARRRIKKLDALDRVTIIDGDARDLGALAGDWPSEIETITAISVVNSFFSHGLDEIVAWLRGLRATFPNRALIIADYFGQIGRRPTPDRLLQLQDVVQVLSGQGIPPGNGAEWMSIYQSADCRLLHMFEDPDATCFIHIIRL